MRTRYYYLRIGGETHRAALARDLRLIRDEKGGHIKPARLDCEGKLDLMELALAVKPGEPPPWEP